MFGWIKREIERRQAEHRRHVTWRAAVRTLREVRRLGYEPPDILCSLACEPIPEFEEEELT